MTVAELTIEQNAPIPTWFRIGGCADRLARPESIDDIRRCFDIDRDAHVLGDGANLLVHDAGIDRLVVSLDAPAFVRTSEPRRDGADVVLKVGAGVRLPRLINETVRMGLGGLEALAGIPGAMGGIVRMNAGGAFGEIKDFVRTVHAVDRDGTEHAIDASDAEFGYRRSAFGDVVITAVELALRPAGVNQLRARLGDVTAYKKRTQPMAKKSAGCCFKNPTLAEPIDGIGDAGDRVSAGLLIDRAGCKGLAIGGASVSELHANFVTTAKQARAADVIELLDDVARRVLDRFGVRLEREVVIWQRGDASRGS
ncbi:MAG: UDP-N-acetylmuramate dehydrogenase [Planctomycetota bacterium]